MLCANDGAGCPQASVTDVYPGGLRVVDDYRWLEDGTSGASKQWAAEQNAHTSAVIDALPLRNRILTFLQQQDAQVTITYSKLQVRGGRLFAMRRSSAESAGKLVTYTDPEDKASERVVLDLAKLTPDHVFQADWFSVSPDAKLVGVALSANGSEDGALQVFSTATGQSTEEPLPHVQYPTAGGAMAWKADSSGFYYTRYPRGTERAAEDANFYQQLYFHKLGTPTAADTYVLGREMPRIGEIGLTSSPDGRHILVSVEDGDGAQFEFFLVGPDSSVRRLCTFKDKVPRSSLAWMTACGC